MRCFGSIFILLVVVSIVQVLCDDAAKETYRRRVTRQTPGGSGGSGGHRGPLPRGPNENPVTHFNEPVVPVRHAQPLSYTPGGGSFGGLNTVAAVGAGPMSAPNLMLGMGIGIGSPHSAAAYNLQSTRNAAALGGGGGLLNFDALGLGGTSRNPSTFGFDSTPNSGNSGRVGGSGLAGVAALNPLGGLINIGGAPNSGLINIGLHMQPNILNPMPQSNQHPPPRHPGNGNPNHGQGQGQGHQPNGGRPGGRPGEGHHNGRPNMAENIYDNGRPGGDGGHQGQNHNGVNGNDRYYEESLNPRPQGNNQVGGNWANGNHGNGNHGQGNQGNGNHGNGNQGGGNQGNGNHGNGSQGGDKNCRGNQYTCQNRECVAKNARCNGVAECQDESDELNCNISENRHGSGQGTSIDSATTAAPFGGSTTASASNSGCTLPEKPTGGSFELGSCEQACNVASGTRVPASSFLTYKCDHGYTLNGNNVSFCHNGSWYLPPTCVRTCSPLKSNSVDIVCKHHGEIVSCESAIAPGTKASLACRHSYKIPLTDDPAYRELTCLEEGIWDRTLFRCLPECGTAVAHGNTLIVNGFTAKLGVFPWHVGIYQKNSADKYDQICAGTLISPDLVVSAAHCFYDDTINEVLDASHYAVGAGKHYRLYNYPEKYAQKSLVKAIEVAGRYYGASGNFAEDISLVRLFTPFTLTTLVRPICMDWDNTYERDQLHDGQMGKAVGWGKTADGEPSNELQEINLPYIPYQDCVSAVPEEFKGYVTADKFCAGYLNGSSLCEGDSGGGLCFQLNGLWYLRGIVSVSPVSQNTCDNNYYTAFTNVGRFREWIRAAYISAN